MRKPDAVDEAVKVARENNVDVVVWYDPYDPDNDDPELRYGYCPVAALRLFRFYKPQLVCTPQGGIEGWEKWKLANK